mgnify:CR=1 FL=1
MHTEIIHTIDEAAISSDPVIDGTYYAVIAAALVLTAIIVTVFVPDSRKHSTPLWALILIGTVVTACVAALGFALFATLHAPSLNERVDAYLNAHTEQIDAEIDKALTKYNLDRAELCNTQDPDNTSIACGGVDDKAFLLDYAHGMRVGVKRNYNVEMDIFDVDCTSRFSGTYSCTARDLN